MKSVGTNVTNKKIIIEELEKLGLGKYYLQMFDEKCELSTRVYLLLKFIGMDQSTLGFAYTKEIICMILEKSDLEHKEMSNLYYDISLKYNIKNISRVERNIRNSKESCLAGLDNRLRILILGNGKMTNGNFAYALANFIKSM